MFISTTPNPLAHICFKTVKTDLAGIYCLYDKLVTADIKGSDNI